MGGTLVHSFSTAALQVLVPDRFRGRANATGTSLYPRTTCHNPPL